MAEKVLLIDDEKEFLKTMRERMELQGMQVKTSSSATEAIERIEKELFDAVILDLQMPGMDGLEALKKIKEKRPELQVILLTGHASVDKGVEAIKLGAMDFIEKPANFKELTDRIKKAKEIKMLIVEKMNEDKIMDMLRRYGV